MRQRIARRVLDGMILSFAALLLFLLSCLRLIGFRLNRRSHFIGVFPFRKSRRYPENKQDDRTQ